MNRLVLIDTQNFFHRAFYAFPPVLSTPEGQVINAVYGFASMLVTLAKELEPTHIVAAYESMEAPVFRQIEYPEYKGTRVSKSPEEQISFESQIPYLFEFLKVSGISVLSAEGYEADDVIGTVAKQVTGKTEVIIASNDQDLMQLINGSIRFYLPAVGKQKSAKFYTKREFMDEYGFKPENLVDYKSLRGDSSDNIPGVRGIGDKTASELIQKYETLEEVYRHLLQLKPAVADKLSTGKESAELSHRLATIVTSAPVKFEIGDLAFGGFDDNPAVLELFKTWGFKSLMAKITHSREGTGEDKSQLKLI